MADTHEPATDHPERCACGLVGQFEAGEWRCFGNSTAAWLQPGSDVTRPPSRMMPVAPIVDVRRPG